MGARKTRDMATKDNQLCEGQNQVFRYVMKEPKSRMETDWEIIRQTSKEIRGNLRSYREMRPNKTLAVSCGEFV